MASYRELTDWTSISELEGISVKEALQLLNKYYKIAGELWEYEGDYCAQGFQSGMDLAMMIVKKLKNY